MTDKPHPSQFLNPQILVEFEGPRGRVKDVSCAFAYRRKKLACVAQVYVMSWAFFFLLFSGEEQTNMATPWGFKIEREKYFCFTNIHWRWDHEKPAKAGNVFAHFLCFPASCRLLRLRFTLIESSHLLTRLIVNTKSAEFLAVVEAYKVLFCLSSPLPSPIP